MNALTAFRSGVDPRYDFPSLPERMTRILGRTLPFLPEETMAYVPSVDLREANGEYVLSAELPGMKENDIQIDVQDGVLTLQGEKTSGGETSGGDGNERWHLVERRFGAFERSFSLPRKVNVEKIRAEFSDGVLTVHLPKGKDGTGKRIPVSAAH